MSTGKTKRGKAPQGNPQAESGKSGQSSVGRNSAIMALGTFFSRLTGQARSILLAWAVGTTGIAANAYQTGSMIPQVLFTILSGGIFNAVLVPQIVRALKEEDAKERLDKIITLSIVLLLGVTLLLMAGTHLVTSLYLSSNWTASQHALVDSFTLWCMPQIFFYGLYTILGQILAAQERFAAYSWSSVGANVIACLGFGLFIRLFGNASHASMAFWTTPRVFLLAGMWTLGVAFQALVLFIPLMQTGYHYRPRWGLRGIGLRSMGSVGVWSLSIVLLGQAVNIFNTRIASGAPIQGDDVFGIAGNATYQNALTIYLLPYSLVAVSIATAIFPRLSADVAEGNLKDARDTLSQSLRRCGVIMLFFTAVLVAIPVPVIKALLPSVPLKEINLIAPVLIALSLNCWAASTFLFLQRTFYAFEDGKHPFIFALIQNAFFVVGLAVIRFGLPPRFWTVGIGVSMTISYAISIPFLIYMTQKKLFHGSLNVGRIFLSLGKSLVAAVATGFVSYYLYRLLLMAFHVNLAGPQGHISWVLSILFCAITGLVALAVYGALLVLTRTDDVVDIALQIVMKLGLGKVKFGRTIIDRLHSRQVQTRKVVSEPVKPDDDYLATALDRADQADQVNQAAQPDQAAELASLAPYSQPHLAKDSLPSDQANGSGQVGGSNQISQINRAKQTRQTNDVNVPAQPMKTASSVVSQRVTPVHTMEGGKGSQRTEQKRLSMNIKPGDVVLNRYELKRLLADGSGMAAFTAHDISFSRDCQLFLVTDTSVFNQINLLTSTLATSRFDFCTPLDQSYRTSQVYLIAQPYDPGISLAQYIHSPAQEADSGASSAPSAKSPAGGPSSALPSSASSISSDHGLTRPVAPNRRLSQKAIRSIIGELIGYGQTLSQAGIYHHLISTQTVRMTQKKLLLADLAVSPILVQDSPLMTDARGMSGQTSMARQIAAVLFELLTDRPFDPDKDSSLADLASASTVQPLPDEFSIICARGLGLKDEQGLSVAPVYTLFELSALLGDFLPWDQLSFSDVEGPFRQETASVSLMKLVPQAPHLVGPDSDLDFYLPPELFTRPRANAQKPARVIQSHQSWDRDQLFERDQEISLQPHTDDFFSEFDDGNNFDDVSSLTGNTPHIAPRAYPEEANSSTRAIAINPAATAASVVSAGAEGLPKSDRGEADQAGTSGYSSQSGKPGQLGQSGHPDHSVHPRTMTTSERLSQVVQPQDQGGKASRGPESLPPTILPRTSAIAGTDTSSDFNAGFFKPSGNSESFEPVEIRPGSVDSRGESASAQASASNSGPASPSASAPASLSSSRQARSYLSFPWSGKTGGSKNNIRADSGKNAPEDERERLYRQQVARQKREERNTLVRKRTLTVALVGIILIVALAVASSALGIFNHPALKSGGNGDVWPSLQASYPGEEGNSSSSGKASPKESAKPSSKPAQPSAKPSSSPAQQKEKPSQSAPAAGPQATSYPQQMNAQAVPAPPASTNTTPLPITSRVFLNKPNGQNGYGLAITFSQKVTVSKLNIGMRDSGGTAYIYADADQTNPINGYALAKFSFDLSGSTMVTLSRPVQTDRIVIWVPADSLPTSRYLYFTHLMAY